VPASWQNKIKCRLCCELWNAAGVQQMECRWSAADGVQMECSISPPQQAGCEMQHMLHVYTSIYCMCTTGASPVVNEMQQV